MILRRALELLPLALVVGTALAALRHGDLGGILRAAIRNTVRTVAFLVLGCALLQVLLLVVQD